MDLTSDGLGNIIKTMEAYIEKHIRMINPCTVSCLLALKDHLDFRQVIN